MTAAERGGGLRKVNSFAAAEEEYAPCLFKSPTDKICESVLQDGFTRSASTTGLARASITPYILDISSFVRTTPYLASRRAQFRTALSVTFKSHRCCSSRLPFFSPSRLNASQRLTLHWWRLLLRRRIFRFPFDLHFTDVFRLPHGVRKFRTQGFRKNQRQETRDYAYGSE